MFIRVDVCQYLIYPKFLLHIYTVCTFLHIYKRYCINTLLADFTGAYLHCLIPACLLAFITLHVVLLQANSECTKPIIASPAQPRVWSVDHNTDLAFTNSTQHTQQCTTQYLNTAATLSQSLVTLRWTSMLH